MKLALIGCGALGLSYASAAAELGLPVAICADPRAAAAKKAASITRARSSTDCTNAIKHKTVDAVLICAPSRAISGYVGLAAKSGKPVLVAPGLASAGDAAQKSIEAACATGVHVYSAYEGRVAPELATIAAQLEQGAIGKPGFIRIVRVGASPHAKAVAGAVASLLPSDLDWLVGRFGFKLRLFAQTTRAPGLDHAAATLTFAAGPIVQWVGTCRAGGESPRVYIEICGTGGMIQFTTEDLILESRTSGKSTLSPHRSNPLAPSPAARQLSRFAALLTSAPDSASYGHDLAILRTNDAVIQSAQTGREVQL